MTEDTYAIEVLDYIILTLLSDHKLQFVKYLNVLDYIILTLLSDE